MARPFHVFISVFTLCCAACSQATITNQLSDDVRTQFDQLPDDVQASIHDTFAQFNAAMFTPFDHDGDDAISRGELSALGDLVIQGERLEGEAAIQFWMDRFDINLDGKIERAEMFTAMIRRRVEQQDAEQ